MTRRIRYPLHPSRCSLLVWLAVTELASLLLLLLLLHGPMLVAVAAADASSNVRLTSGAEHIESNFPSQTTADGSTSVPSSAGYPARSLQPLRAVVARSESAALLEEAAAAFKAQQPSFDIRFTRKDTNEDIKHAFFEEGTSQHNQPSCFTLP
jgi:hypothetical protein